MSLVAALQPVVQAFERLGVPYLVGGSVASSAHGSPRSTNDVDLVAGLRAEHVEPLRAALGADYYAPAELLFEAIRRRTCANLLHIATGFKIDIFVPPEGFYETTSMARAVLRDLAPGSRTFRVYAAEDILLRKLLWFRAGDEVSYRHWNDILGILRLRRSTLDHAYLDEWAAHLAVADLLARARRDAS